MDESGLSTVQKPSKIFAQKGNKQVGPLTSAERGQHVSIAVCANAAGNFVPPATIIPRKNHKPEYFDGAPAGTLQLCYETGYMVGHLFVKWMKHFVSSTGCNLTNKVILILDGHSSHKSLEALEFAKANAVILLCLPSHCTHRMQPLDVSFFGPLDAYYNCEMTTWLKAHPGGTVGLYQVASIFGKAYGSAASIGNITSGFEKTGIYPINPHVFPDHLFLPSEVTKNVIEVEIDDRRHEEGNDDEFIRSAVQLQPNLEDVAGSSSSITAQNTINPATGGLLQRDRQVIAGSSTTQDILKEISPLPKSASTGQARNTKRKTTGPQVMTSTPFLYEVKTQVQNKKKKKNRKSTRVRKQVKQSLFQDDSDTEPDFIQNADDRDASDSACIYCNELYSKSKPGEHWVCCQLCERWSHTLFAGIDRRTKMFQCELCTDN